MPHRTAYPLAASVGGVVASAAGSLAQTANDAAGAVGQGGATVAWAGTALALGGLATQLYFQFRAARRKADADDAEAKLEQDTREHAVWGPKYEAEMGRRVEAEARLKVAEEQIQALRAEVDALKARQRKTAEKINQEVIPAVNKATERVAAVEAQQGSSSNLSLPALDKRQ